MKTWGFSFLLKLLLLHLKQKELVPGVTDAWLRGVAINLGELLFPCDITKGLKPTQITLSQNLFCGTSQSVCSETNLFLLLLALEPQLLHLLLSRLQGLAELPPHLTQ